MGEPLVTVVSYIREDFDKRALYESVASFFKQTLDSFELRLVCDHLKTLERIAQTLRAFTADSRLVLSCQQGVTEVQALNRAIEQASGSYITRMVVGGISEPDRLRKQVACLDTKTDCGLVTAWTEIPGLPDYHGCPLTHEDMLVVLLVSTSLDFGSALFRKTAWSAVGGYNEQLSASWDYDICIRISERHELSNLPQALYSTSCSPTPSSEPGAEQRNRLRERILRRDSLTLLERAISIAPSDSFLVDTFYRYVKEHFPSSHPDYARRCTDAGIVRCLHSGSASAYVDLARRYQEQRNKSLTFLCYLKALALDPALEDVYDTLCSYPNPLAVRQTLNLEEDDKCAVSVIMPTYNRLHTIRESIESILAQSFRDFEIVIVNDGGTDKLKDIIDEFKSPHIRYLEISHRGLAGALNAGLQFARGKYICYLDDDDVYYPHHLQTLWETVTRTGSAWAYAKSRVVRGRRCNGGFEAIQVFGSSTQPFSTEELHQRCIISVLNVIHSRELISQIGGFNEELPWSMDWDMWVRMAQHAVPIFIDDYTGEYRITTDNMTVRRTFVGEFVMDLLSNYYQSSFARGIFLAAASRLKRDSDVNRLIQEMLDDYYPLGPRVVERVLEAFVSSGQGTKLWQQMLVEQPHLYVSKSLKYILKHPGDVLRSGTFPLCTWLGSAVKNPRLLRRFVCGRLLRWIGSG